MAEHSQPAAPFPSSISSEKKPGGSVTAGAKRGWRGKVGYEQQLCVSHSVSLPRFPLWEASRKQICESHLELPHIPELCPVPAEEELLVTASQGQWGGTSASSGTFLLLPWHCLSLSAPGSRSCCWVHPPGKLPHPVLAPLCLSLCCSDTRGSLLLPQPLLTVVQGRRIIWGMLPLPVWLHTSVSVF